MLACCVCPVEVTEAVERFLRSLMCFLFGALIRYKEFIKRPTNVITM